MSNQGNLPLQMQTTFLPYSWLLFALSLFFIVYGSLLPLDFNNISFDFAIKQFAEILQHPVKISRSDFATNILITIPLSFSLAALFSRYLSVKMPFIIIFSITVCLLITFSVEFLQLFTKSRVPSRSDVIAQFIGNIIGASIWLFKGDQISLWFQSWADKKEKWDFYEKVLWIYIVCLFIYNILPLELVTTPVEIYHKWVQGRIQLIPFLLYSKEPFLMVYQVITDILIWFPVTFLWILSRQKTPLGAFLWTIKLAIIIECMQLFILPRVTDIIDIITAILGAGGAVVFSKFILKKQAKAIAGTDSFFPLYLMLLLIVWSVIVIVVFWYPFSFTLQKEFVLGRINFIYEIPFLSYLNSSPFITITTVTQKLLFLAPIGILFRVIKYKLPQMKGSLISLYAVLWSVVLVLTIEVGQMLIPERSPDTTDVILGFISIWLGYISIEYYFTHMGEKVTDERSINKHALNKVNEYSELQFKGTSLAIISFQIISFVLIIYLLGFFEKTPYNIGLFFSFANVFQHIIFTLSIISCALLPLWIISNVQNKPEYMWKIYPLLLLTSIFVFMLLLISIPGESIHYILGAPILYWSWDWGTIIKYGGSFGRFSILLASILWCLAGAFCLSNRTKKGMLQAFYLWLLLSMIVFPLSHYVIIINTGMDNVTELLRDGGGWLPSLLIFCLLFLLFYTTNLLGSIITGIKRIKVKYVIFFIVSLPISYFLAAAASEEFIIKNGSVFSAMQFLLSPDRTQYVPQKQIYFHYLFAYTLMIISIVWFQLSYWISCRMKIFKSDPL